ncbi:MAG: T9SS type A sorting domain-containing protein [Bacteroidetes bacterium]|nr:T9SS type A sorting domain-containing protein [Bacteroidota bacterium]
MGQDLQMIHSNKYERDTVELANDNSFITPDSIFFGTTLNWNLHLHQDPEFSKEDQWYGVYNIKHDGILNWQKYYGGDANYKIHGLVATRDGGALILGGKWDWRNNPVKQGDTYIIKIDRYGNFVPKVGVGINEHFEVKNILLYPNPSHNKLNINIGMYKSLHLKIYNIQGSLVAEQTLQSGINSIDVSGFSKGIYTYLIEGEKGFFEKGKFVKE